MLGIVHMQCMAYPHQIYSIESWNTLYQQTEAQKAEREIDKAAKAKQGPIQKATSNTDRTQTKQS